MGSLLYTHIFSCTLNIQLMDICVEYTGVLHSFLVDVVDVVSSCSGVFFCLRILFMFPLVTYG